ncbi:Uncharacterised protein [Yersinia mollaretii]|nr:Uncharacterised protein [Yersinia mollaretii]CQR16378.1 Uncharacterised protein [Yersinia mollaretii]
MSLDVMKSVQYVAGRTILFSLLTLTMKEVQTK